jgi:hypothetical protein
MGERRQPAITGSFSSVLKSFECSRGFQEQFDADIGKGFAAARPDSVRAADRLSTRKRCSLHQGFLSTDFKPTAENAAKTCRAIWTHQQKKSVVWLCLPHQR